MTRKIKRSDCYGCYDEVYHCGCGGSQKCWTFEGAEMRKGRLQHKDTLPKNYKGRWKLIPDCYVYQDGFVERWVEE
jgi:hypothetical protein